MRPQNPQTLGFYSTITCQASREYLRQIVALHLESIHQATDRKFEESAHFSHIA